MNNLISVFNNKIKIITPNDDYHYFFAYYDMRATGENGINKKHLCHRVKFMDRLPTPNDVCELGYLDDNEFYKIGETTAWNFQQGAMLQYHPFKEDTVFYNVEIDGKFKTVTHNFKTGEKSYTDMATACVSPDGRYGLSINFGRIFAFRPGYGYANFIDKNANVNAPSDDGVFLTNMATGKSRLLVSYKDMAKKVGFNDNDKILVNHITFNTTSNKYVMLVRNFPQDGKMWGTSMVVGDLNGNIKTILEKTYVSHYKWITSNKILVHCNVKKGEEYRNLYIINVDDCSFVEYDSYYFHREHNPDIHCSLSPDGKYIIGDGYPIGDYRSILAINLKTMQSKEIVKVKTNNPICTDIRCDLHARYVYDGTHVSFDTLHNGKRQIAVFPISEINF